MSAKKFMRLGKHGDIRLDLGVARDTWRALCHISAETEETQGAIVERLILREWDRIRTEHADRFVVVG